MTFLQHNKNVTNTICSRQNICFEKTLILIIILFNSLISSGQSIKHKSLTLWYNQPAKNWEEESLPIGNGYMGASIMGEIDNENVFFNEKTLWSGGPGAKGYDYGNGRGLLTEQLTVVRNRIDNELVVDPNWVSKELGQEKTAFGDYQIFGTLHIIDLKPNARTTNYYRELDIEKAIATVSYKKGNNKIVRSYFASFPDKSIIIHIASSSPGTLSYKFSIGMPETRKFAATAKSGIIRINGRLEDNELYYESLAKIINKGGTRNELSDGSIEVKGADEVTIILTAATNYKQEYPSYRGELPDVILTNRLKTASKLGYTRLVDRHVKDYRALFSRVKLDLGQTENIYPTDQLLKFYHDGTANNGQQRTLENIFFQYGRYLLIAASRPGSLPANLQGVWNNVTNPPWNSDYHHNINLQMNYWLAESTNLAETAEPLFNHISSLLAPGAESAKKLYGAPGWVTHIDMNVYGYTGLGYYPTAFWFPEAAAWLSQHLFEHYLFGGDLTFLRTRAYPVMKGATEFWLSQLKTDKRDGQLVITPSFSPENERFGYVAGAAMSQQIIYELFVNTIKAAEILKIDQPFHDKVATALATLDPGLRIGSWGQLQEWKHDADLKTDQHRHVSHLYALHPGKEISPIKTPELAQAAKVSLNARGDGGTGWSKAWKINFWARLLDGDHAFKMLSEQLKQSTYKNLWDTHPPFQIDGNYGATSGIAEMLLQSQNDESHILPAVPSAWPDGNVIGLRARGGQTIDISWERGQIKTLVVHADQNGKINLRSSLFKRPFTMVSNPNATLTMPMSDNGLYSFFATKGSIYTFKPK